MSRRITLALACAMAMLLVGVSAPGFAEVPTSESAVPNDGAKFVEITADEAILAKLRQGGLVLYLRHGTTDNTRADRFPAVDLDDCSTQRPLNDDGRRFAVRLGEAVRRARIPIGEIRISPLCRVRQTAALAFPNASISEDRELMYPANLTSTQKQPIIANTRRLLSAPVARGSNRLLIAHAPNLMDLIGYFPQEGTLVVFQPRAAAGFDYVASIPPAQWGKLLRENRK